MRRVITILFVLVAITNVQAQKFELTHKIDSFGVSIRNNLAKIQSQKALITGENLELIWPSLSSEDKNTIIAHVSMMIEKNYKIKPTFIEYFEMLDKTKTIAQIDDLIFSQLLDVTGKVIELHPVNELSGFIFTVNNFLEHKALYLSASNQLLFHNASYSFSYHGGAQSMDFAVDTAYDDTTEGDEYEYNDDYENDYDDYDEEEYDEYDDEYDDYDEYDEYDDEYEEEFFLEEEYFADPPLPLTGPVITFENTNLDIISQRKHAVISNTKGSFIIFQQTFTGDGGSIDWGPGGLEEKANVSLQTYNFAVRRPIINAKVVSLNYPEKLNEPIEGEFEYNGEIGISGMKFVSYQSDIIHSNQGVNGLSLTGGFSLIGSRVATRSKRKSAAVLSMTSNGVNKFMAVSTEFIIADSTIQGKNCRTTLYHGMDSIYHPSTQFRFDTRTKEVVANSVGGDYRYAPFYSSYTNMEITADMIRWDIDSDTLEMSIISGKAELPVLIQSAEYFDPEILASFSRNYNFNPIMLIATYVSKTHIREFYPADIADYNNLNAKELSHAMADLAMHGYLNFNKYTQLYSLRKKAVHYSMAKRNKVDFDNLLLISKVTNGPNIIFDMRNNEMHLNGIEKFYISEVLDVYIIPDSSRITLGKDREFTFNGKLFAGNFEYGGSGFRFNYDSFMFDLTKIDQIQLYTLSKNSKRSKIQNVISGISDADSAVVSRIDDFQGTSGKLIVNKPDNKSGKKIYPNYPKFEGGGSGFVVYFNGKEYLNGVYGKAMYMKIPPFNLDSLSDSDPAAINFRGRFHSNDIMPEFSEMLHIMDDGSLGFTHSIPPGGYPLFEGDAKVFNTMSLDKEGLRSRGDLTFLTSSFYSDSYLYYPDSIISDGLQFVMKHEEFNGVIFPDITAEQFKMKWLTTVDSMHLDNINNPFSLYNGIAELDGRTTLTHKGVFGSGNLISLGSETYSKEYEFKSDRFLADHAHFQVNSNDPEKPALSGADVRIDFDLITKKAKISPEIEGEAALEFPYAQFKTSIPTAIWDLDSGIVSMTKPENIDIESSYFYTTREDLDSLRFNATYAKYDMNTQELLVGGIPYITVADSEITPENGEVLILENSRIGTLRNTTLVIDTLNGYHRLYNGTINVISRNEFSGSATYEFVNATQDTFAIKLSDFHLEQLTENKRKGDHELQTVASGTVEIAEKLIISPGLLYKGEIIMRARKPALEMDGYVKLDLSVAGYNTWIQYSSDAEQQEVVIDFDNAQTEFGEKLIAGLHFDYNDYSLYHTFINNKREIGDEDFFVPSGNLRFYPDDNEYVIMDENKELGLSYGSKMMVYKEDSSYIYIEGPINLLETSKSVNILGAVIGNGNTETKEYSFDAMLALDFDVNSGVFDLMARGFLEAIDLVGASEAAEDRTTLLYNLANIIGDKAAKEYEKRSNEAYTPLLSMSPKLVKPIIISEIKLKWSDDQKSFYNENPTMGISNVLRTDINAAFEGFFEVQKAVDGDKINLFIKASPDYWYHFSYEDNKMLIYSSDPKLNDFVKQKTNQGKAKISEFVFAPGDIGETQSFVNTFQRIYYGIKEPYDLGGEIQVDAEEKKKVTDDDDDEGF